MNSRNTFNFQLKSLDEQEVGKFEGYVAYFDNIDLGHDVVDRKAFAHLDINKSYPLLADHDHEKVIGKFKVMTDDVGLKMIDGQFNLLRDPETKQYLVPLAAEKYANLKHGDIVGASMGYIPALTKSEQKDGKKIRRIVKCDLKEGSVVTFPMNESAGFTSVKTNLEESNLNIEEIKDISDVKQILNQVGLSEIESKQLIQKIISIADKAIDSSNNNAIFKKFDDLINILTKRL